MEKGRLEVHGTVSGALFYGFSLQDLYWYNADRSSSSRRRIINSGDGRVGYGCKPCGIISMDTTKPSGKQLRRARRRARFRRK